MYQKNKFIFGIFLILFCACSTTPEGKGVLINQLRPVGEPIHEEHITINRKLYQQLLGGGGSYTKARMVEVFTREAASGIKEYRLFGVQPGSLYDLLGLRNVDILVAANGYIIPQHEIFWQYLQVLPKQKEAFIEIKRAGKSMVLKYKFKD